MTSLKKTGLILLAVFALQGIALSQDIHFSQFYASPLTLNPALTGKMNGDYRLAAIYRNQWRSIASPFVTPSASFDMPFLLGKKRTSAVGVGLMFVNDKSNDGNMKKLSFMLSAAYHKALGKSNAHQLSIGLQGGYVQTTVAYQNFIFSDQYVNGVFTNPTTNENFSGENVSYPDFNIGLFYSGRIIKRLTLFAGYSLFHLIPPKESIKGDDFKLPSCHVAHGGLEVGLTEKLMLMPGVIFMHQANAREINFGTNFGYKISTDPGKQVTAYLGVWYRWEDAAIVMAAVELMERLRVGFSYDINTSGLTNSTNGRGGFEISAIYVGNIVRIKESNLFCPRF